jgi:formylglycine-generating enzyme required for sulfatase activity
MYNEISAEFENYIKKGKVENAAGTLKRLDSFVKENSLSHSTKKYKRVLNKISKMVFIPGKNIYMDKFEITVKDYKDYSKTKAGVKFPFLPEWNKDDFQPMINVSFDDAQKFAGYNGKRLPTLDEWKAAAGLSKSNNNFFSDDESPRRYANVYDLVSSSKDTYTKTAPVGKFAPNKNNLYDLVGNVEEWCIGSGGTPTRVGGHYGTKESRSRSFRSKTHNPDYTSERVGFRCVVDVDTLLK